MFDLYPCLKDHAAYTRRTCPCHTSYYLCTICGEGITVCPGCHHADIRRRILAGEVVFPESWRIDENTAQDGIDHAGNSSREDHTPAGAVGELAREGEADVLTPTGCKGSDQAVTLDAPSLVLYNPLSVPEALMSHHAPALGNPPVDTPPTPLIVLLLPVDLASVPPVLQALAAVIAPHAMGGHLNGHDASVEGGQRLPRHLAKKCYLSDTPCPSGHSYRDTGKVLRYHGNNQCVPCSGQRKPTRTAASTAAHTEG